MNIIREIKESTDKSAIEEITANTISIAEMCDGCGQLGTVPSFTSRNGIITGVGCDLQIEPKPGCKHYLPKVGDAEYL